MALSFYSLHCAQKDFVKWVRSMYEIKVIKFGHFSQSLTQQFKPEDNNETGSTVLQLRGYSICI